MIGKDVLSICAARAEAAIPVAMCDFVCVILPDKMETLLKKRKKKSKRFERKVIEYVFARHAHFD